MFLRRAILAVFFSLPLLFAASTSVVRAEDDNEYYDFDEYVDEVIAAADDFWREQASRLGFRYTSPEGRSVAYDERVRSKCGRSRGVSHSYCPSESRIYLDYDSDEYDSLWALWDDERPFVIVTVVGHEWGHHIQNLLGLINYDPADSVNQELQADCLMGVFTRAYQRDSDWVEQAEVRDAILSTTESGDDEDTEPDEFTHGTADLRLDAFLRGYRSANAQDCGI